MSKKLKVGDMMKASDTVSAPVITPEVTPVSAPVSTPGSATSAIEIEALKALIAQQADALKALQISKPKGFSKQGLAGFEIVHREVVKTLDAKGNIRSDILGKEYITKINDIARSESSAKNYNGGKAEITIFKSALASLHERYTFVEKPVVPVVPVVPGVPVVPVVPVTPEIK